MSCSSAPRNEPLSRPNVAWRHVAGLLLLVAIATIPLALAGTQPASGCWALIGLVGAACTCWIAGLFQERRVPWAGPVPLFGFAAFVCASFPWVCQLTDPTSVAEFSRAHFANVAARWPDIVGRKEIGASIALHASLCLVLWMVADLARDHAWMMRLATAMVTVAVIVTSLALMQNLSHATAGHGMRIPRPPGFSWGPFFHHTSAGAFLNTTWPLAAGLVFQSWRLTASGRFRKFAGSLSLFALALLLGAHTSHVSRFPQIAALAVAPLLLFRMKSLSATVSRYLIGALIAGVVLFALCFGRTGTIAQRWLLMEIPAPKTNRVIPPEEQWPSLVRDDLLIPNRYNAGRFGDRGEAQRTALRAIEARPFVGHGPGNWLGAASHYSADPYVRTFYLYLLFAHDDFLQAWVESGFAGFISLLCLLGGGMLVGLRQTSQSPAPGQTLLPFAAALGLAAVLLQSLIDFPLQIPAVAFNAHVLAGLCWGGASPSSPTIVPS